MGDRVPQLSSKELLQLLTERGFVLRRITGSHHILRRPEDGCAITVPIHAHDLKRPLLLTILKQAGIKKDELNG
jgi:predicted RNA binding protein YcfA (HicA-like mRNA interferase family)